MLWDRKRNERQNATKTHALKLVMSPGKELIIKCKSKNISIITKL